MRQPLFQLLLISVLAGGGWGYADDPVAVDEAESFEGVLSEDDQIRVEGQQPAAEISLSYDHDLAEAAGRRIADEISVDLIDLDEMQRALERVPGREKLRLSLDECIRIALSANPDIQIASMEPGKAEADVFSARGEFDPVLQAMGVYNRTKASANQQVEVFGGISSIESYTTDVNAGVSGRLTTGTQYTATFVINKEESTFGNFIEEFQGTLSLQLTQPLLRGFGRDINRTRIMQAQNARQVSEAQFRLSVLNTMSEVVKAYWDLVGSIENLKVQNSALANAERLLTINQKRREIGTAADLEVLQAKAGVATRNGDLINAQARVLDAGDRLKLLLDLQDDGLFSKVQVVPIDSPNLEDTTIFDPAVHEEGLDRSVQLALEKRPEMSMSELEIDNAVLEVARARNDVLPQFDLTGSVSAGGRDHKLRQTLYGVRGANDYTYSYGFQASVPIMNRAARGAHQRAKITEAQAERRLHQTRQSIMLNVHLAARNVSASRVLVESSGQARRLQEVNVLAEEKKLRLGTTTSFQVLQIQEDLTAAQTQEAQALVAYEKALVDLQLAEGTLLENFGVDVTAAETDAPIGQWRGLVPRWE